jgi:hypothetical protein
MTSQTLRQRQPENGPQTNQSRSEGVSVQVPRHIPRVPARKKPPEGPQFHVGDRVTVSFSGGRIVDATVTAVVKRTAGIRLQVSYGRDETALVYLWQGVRPVDS